MKKSLTGRRRPLLAKALMMTKLTVAFLLFFTLNLAARGLGQDKISLKAKKTEISTVLSSIEKQTTYRFLYNENMEGIRKKVTVNLQNAPLEQALNEILLTNGLNWTMSNSKLIVVNESALNAAFAIVTGTVRSPSGDPIAGVSVSVKGSQEGTTTDGEGKYSINAPDGATLVFSSVGFASQELLVDGRTVIDVTMQNEEVALNEVVVIGYGTANKRDLTGSIVKVSGDEVKDKPNTNPIASLQGKVAGLSVVNNGTPGAAPDIRIRGTSSIGQVHPLYVVDGIFNDNIDYLNPNDIESIEVLKDPSSLAIFGVKGATGVIAITTKKAKAGQVLINVNTNYGFKNLVDKIKLASASEFDMLFAEENANNNVATPDYSALKSNTDWIDAVTRTGKFSATNLSISASSEKNRFNFGLGYQYDEGIIRHQQLDKILMSLADEFKISKAIKLGVNLNASRQHNPYGADWVLDAARKVMPHVSAGTKMFKVQNPYGVDSIDIPIYSGLDVALQNSGVNNPLLALENEWDKFISYEYRTVGSVYAEINFLKNFNWRTTVYGDISNVDSRTYVPLYYAYDPLTDQPYLYSSRTQVTESFNTWRKYQQDHILTYKKDFGKHGLTATAGFTTYYFGNFNRSGVGKPYTTGNALPIPNDERLWYLSNYYNDPAQTVASSSQGEYSTASVLGRILYNYNDKYYLNASLRDDASSQIPTKNRHQKFWALGAAWDLTRESFMETVDFFNFLKLKGSIGVLGNQSIPNLSNGQPNYYPFYPNLQSGVAAVFGTSTYNAADEQYRVNPDLKWETVHAKEIGVELMAFDNRLHFEANYFNRVTKDLMTYIGLGSLGLKDELTNGGSLRNWGEEFSASWTENFNSGLTVNLGGNITFLKNKVLSLSPDLPGGVIIRGFQNNGSAEARTLVGYPIGSFFGYVVDGIYQSYADILASPVASSLGAYRPGDFKFRDINGPDGKGPDGKITSDDRVVIGNPTPDFTYGASLNVSYKGLSLGVDIVGVYGNEIFRTWGSLESPFQRVNYSGDKVDRWNGPGTSNWVPIISQADRFNYNGSTYNIEDGSYVRIRNIQLGYSFNKAAISRLKLKDLRIFANVQNLKTFKHNYGYTTDYGGDATAFGFDNAGGAIPVVTTFGLNLSF